MRPLLILSGFIFFLSTLPAWAATPQELYASGVQSYQQKQYDKAIADLKEAVGLDPQFWQAYQMLGSAYFQNGDTPDAVTAIQTSLKLHPDNPGLRKFADQISPKPAFPELPSNIANAPVSTNPQVSAPISSTGMSVKPMGNVGSKSQHIFFNLGLFFEEPLGGNLSSADQAYKKNPPPSSGFDNFESNEPEIFGFAVEVGYDLDKENGLSFCIYPPGADSGPAFNTESSNQATGDHSYENISGLVDSFGIRYYRYLPDGLGRWFGFVSADYYDIDVSYSIEHGTGLYPSDSGSSTSAESLTGNTVGGSLGIGRQLDIFGFLSLEASVAFKYANVTQVTGAYTSSTTTNNVPSPGPSGQGTLVTLSDGSIVLVDQKYVGSAKITNFDLTGVEGRAVLDFWF